MQRQPLPHELGSAFHVREANARGVPRSRLRAGDLDRPFRGVYAVAVAAADGDPATSRETEIIALAVLAALQMGGEAFFSHVTSAVIWGIPLPSCVLEDDLDVGVFHPARPPRAVGIRGHRVQARHATTRRHAGTGLVLASPASTWAMLGSRLTDPYDVVAAAEALISDRRFGVPEPLTTLAQLEAAVSSGRRVGIGALRAALPRVRPHVASRTETWTRLTLIDGGLPEPEINYDAQDDSGHFLACVDLAYPDLKIAIEYEGEHHLLDAQQWTKDIGRYDRLHEAGWRVIRVTKDELFRHPDLLVARVRRALRARG